MLVAICIAVLAGASIQVRVAMASSVTTPDELSLLTRYAGLGYNALQANPEGDFYQGGINPGIKTTRFIFNHTYCEGKQVVYNGRPMLVPDQVEFQTTGACVMTEAANAYSGQTSYKEELSLSVDASGKWL